jgi:hypothetical protein
VEIHLLPPTTTSHLQPLDAGIIQCFKGHYRRQHLWHLVDWTATVHLHLWGSLGVQLAGYLYFVQQVHYEPNNLRLCLMTLHSMHIWRIERHLLKSFNSKMKNQKRKVLLIMDNAPSHSVPNLSNVEIHFLPPTTTSHLQSLDYQQNFTFLVSHFEIKRFQPVIKKYHSHPCFFVGSVIGIKIDIEITKTSRRRPYEKWKHLHRTTCLI